MSTHSEVMAVPTVYAASTAVRVAWIAGAVLVAAAAYYFVGIDQGVVSVFGSDTHIHEMMHDGRHLLGFPCH
ncbi:CbtB-domain containing protein [Microbacterium sp. SORGH_AS_0862]|uniref:CbtB domain-containing protein n=1 Tax=Microbacterium sp. SORGH_AS_0862 TaxID=3041789 RepID=UPI00278EFDF4|nr:CbtB-domain containing protein [Microbacterium sp. SORGH_AS_0862]MDQ1205831.1 hypothetical protein [Microbacterium sp. SORGH_AS_0862]